MLSQYGIKLAVHIITADFGNLVAKVCECLLRKGTLPKLAIEKHLDLLPNKSDDKVKKCLLVLIQHNCVQAFTLSEEGAYGQKEETKTKYMALFKNIICRLRFPKYLTVVSRELDQECAVIVEGLLQHGRLTLSQILDRARDLSNEGEIVRERFMKLVEARYIERCPAAQPPVLLETAEGSANNKGTNKSKKIVQMQATLEDRVIAASTLMDAERFSIKTVTGEDIAEESRSNGSNKMKVGNKRKHNSSEVVGDIDNSGKDPTWRVNFDEFKRLSRKKACVESAKTSHDDEAGVVLSAFLEASKAMGNTVSSSLNAVFEEVIKSEEGVAITFEHVRDFLVQLGCDSTSHDDAYTLDLTEFIKRAQREEVESIVLKRYGKEAYRLFRLLAESKVAVETSRISGSALVEHKDARKILYKLWIENYLHMESVRRPPQGEFFEWSVNQNLNELVLDEMFHVALNLRVRMAYEMDQRREVMRVQDKQKGDVSKKFEKLKAVKMLLDSCLAKIDDAIMLFHDF